MKLDFFRHSICSLKLPFLADLQQKLLILSNKAGFERSLLLFFILLLIITSCKQCPEKVPPFTLKEFNGRDETISYGYLVRRPVYQAKVPLRWKRMDSTTQEPILDNTKPIVLFALDEHVTLTVHSFPTNCLEERIPVTAQVEQWRSQFKATECCIESVDRSCFVGLFLEAKNNHISLFAWSLGLDLEHYQTLHFLAATVEEEEHYKQMGADVTIKVSGPTDTLKKYRDEIFLFANSFELIQELPMR